MGVLKKHKALRIALVALLVVLVSLFGFVLWLSGNYKNIIQERIPKMLSESTDSIYHITIGNINVNLFKNTAFITDVKLWPDTTHAKRLRSQGRKVPNTLLTMSIPHVQINGINWGRIIGNRSISFNKVVVHNIKWLLDNKPYPKAPPGENKKRPFIHKITIGMFQLVNPDIAYTHDGPKSQFTYHMEGGTVTVNKWAYNFDQSKDTSLFLYARSGSLRFNSFTILKKQVTYTATKPVLDFTTTEKSVKLTNLIATNVPKTDRRNGNIKEIYNIRFPEIQLQGLNWNKLINSNTLSVNEMNISHAAIDVKHFTKYYTEKYSKLGSYPSQILLDQGLKIQIKTLHTHQMAYSIISVTSKMEEVPLAFTDINGSMHNVTNMPSAISLNKNCDINLKGRFMGKSELAVNFSLGLADKSGRFAADGYISNLNGKDIETQAKALTIVAVTHFQLKKMNFHIDGDETYTKGDFTILYNDLKISLLKFDTKMRDGKKGPFAFLAGNLVLYPNNPMPGKDVRKVSTSLAREPTNGFTNEIWACMLRAAKKTAIRNQDLVDLQEGKETGKGEQPKKGLLKKLFGKKN